MEAKYKEINWRLKIFAQCCMSGFWSSELSEGVLQTLLHSCRPDRLLAAELGQVANYCGQDGSEFKSHLRPCFCLSILQQLHLAGHQPT